LQSKQSSTAFQVKGINSDLIKYTLVAPACFAFWIIFSLRKPICANLSSLSYVLGHPNYVDLVTT